MATIAELARLRDMISEPDLTDGWTDERLEAVLVQTTNSNGTVNLRAAASAIWEAKAAEASELVDVTESSSSRRQSQYFDHALKMAGQYGSSAMDPSSTVGRPHSVGMRRPTRG